jgi:hypothetical protein
MAAARVGKEDERVASVAEQRVVWTGWIPNLVGELSVFPIAVDRKAAADANPKWTTNEGIKTHFDASLWAVLDSNQRLLRCE